MYKSHSADRIKSKKQKSSSHHYKCICTYTINESPWSPSAGPSSPLLPSSLMHTGVRHNTATIYWTVPRIAYTPENYTVHFGTSPGSLTPFNQQQQSGDNFTATNLQFSLQLTGLSAGTTYYYQVVAVNSVGSAASVEQSFVTTTLCMLRYTQAISVVNEIVHPCSCKK